MPESRQRTDVATTNVEIVRGTFAALERGDFDAWVAPLAPDVTVCDEDHGQIATTRDGFRRWLEDFLEAWEYYRETPEHIIPVGDQVVALVRSQARGASSQVVIEQCQGEVHTITDGRITRVELYTTYAAALAAVGLEDAELPPPEPAPTAPAGTRGGGRFRRRARP